eukprot:g3204.t1
MYLFALLLCLGCPMIASAADKKCSGNGVYLECEGKCGCLPGFSGNQCERDNCEELHGCNGHGICKNAGCSCNPGWTGKDCNTKQACPKNASGKICSNSGECFAGTCFCFPGYAGPACNMTPKCSGPGMGGCNSPNGLCHNGKCLCMPGFSGPTCEKVVSVKKCPNNCGGESKGECRQGKCYCNPGFKGESCSERVECPGNCNAHGMCQYGKCFCDPGWTGVDCRNKTGKQSCLHGEFINGRCWCDLGWRGENCDEGDSCKDDCNGRGICFREKCVCASGYEGDACESDAGARAQNELLKECVNGCSGHGICAYGMASFDTGEPLGKCLCQPNYEGEFCEKAVNCPKDCSGNGQCTNGKCVCDCGYEGAGCETPSLGRDLCPDDCGKNGDCILGRCYCHPGHDGERCELKVSCSKGENGKECGGHGQCKYGKCFCDPGWSGDSCEGSDQCPRNCSGHGVCCNSRCLCTDGWNGEDCMTSSKLGKLSKKFNTLQALPSDSSFRFKAISTEDDEKCPEDSHGAICAGNGVCANAKCFCNPGFEGSTCEDVVECPNNCFNNGICRNGLCFCNPGFQGNACAEVVPCQNDCFGNGICANGQCFCNPGFSGNFCALRLSDSMEMEKNQLSESLNTPNKIEPTQSSSMKMSLEIGLIAFLLGVFSGVGAMWLIRRRTQNLMREIFEDSAEIFIENQENQDPTVSASQMLIN